MKSSPFKRTKITFALLALLSMVASSTQIQASACENTDSITLYIREHASHEVREEYLKTYEKITVMLRDFVYNTTDGRKIGYYAKELGKLSKELNEIAKKSHGSHGVNAVIHKRLTKLHKDFERFINILRENQNAFAWALLAKLKQQEELLSLVPSELGWSPKVVSDAITTRCNQK